MKNELQKSRVKNDDIHQQIQQMKEEIVNCQQQLQEAVRQKEVEKQLQAGVAEHEQMRTSCREVGQKMMNRYSKWRRLLLANSKEMQSNIM